MSTSPITSWQIEWEKVEAVTDFVFLGSKITVDSDCSHEIKRCLLLGRKAMTNLDSILKSRAITADKGPYSQSYGAITDSMNMSLSQLREIAKDREASWGHKDHDQIMGSQKSVTEQQRFFQ